MRLLLLLLPLLADALWLPKALFLEGLSAEEDLPETLYDHYETLASHPLRINSASAAQLTGSGLFDDYQAACILDYRSRQGAVISITELSAVDGIGRGRAEALEPFISLSYGDSLYEEERRLHADASIKGSVKNSQFNAAAKGQAEYGQIQARAGWKQGSGNPALALQWSPRRSPMHLYLGSVNARFGQGLAMSSGMSMTSLKSASSFAKSSSGLSPSSSFSSDYNFKALAADAFFGPLAVSAMATLDGLYVANARYLLKTASLGATVYTKPGEASCISLDGRWTRGQICLFGEAAYSWAAAWLMGATWRPKYGSAVSVLLRDYPAAFSALYSGAFRSFSSGKDERGVSLAGEWNKVSFSLDYAQRPLKQTEKLRGQILLSPEFRCGNVALKPSLRSTASLTPDKRRVDLRAGIAADWKEVSSTLRLDWAWTGGRPGFSALADMGFQHSEFKLFVRASVFRVDDWDSRIYVYERDIPGNFNVVALYGQGWTASLYAVWRHLYLRAATTQYIWMDKAPKSELKLGWKLRI